MAGWFWSRQGWADLGGCRQQMGQLGLASLGWPELGCFLSSACPLVVQQASAGLFSRWLQSLKKGKQKPEGILRLRLEAIPFLHRFLLAKAAPKFLG